MVDKYKIVDLGNDAFSRKCEGHFIIGLTGHCSADSMYYEYRGNGFYRCKFILDNTSFDLLKERLQEYNYDLTHDCDKKERSLIFADVKLKKVSTYPFINED